MLIKLSYNYKADRFRHVTVLGDVEGIRDLYWQLTHNYQPQDGTAIGEIEVTNLDGESIPATELMRNPYGRPTLLSKLT